MTEDQIIRAACDAIATAAPPAERVRARITARARVHHQRRAVLVGAAAAVTAVGVPLILRERRAEPQLAVPGATTGPPAPWQFEVPLRYVPGWLPEQVVERFREVKFQGTGMPVGSCRKWLPPGTPFGQVAAPAQVTLAVNERIDGDDGDSEPVKIGSVTGRLISDDMTTYVAWQPAGRPLVTLMVFGLPQVTDVALRIARSVRTGPGGLRVSLRSTAVPARCRGYTYFGVDSTREGWWQYVRYTSTDYRENAQVVAQTIPAPENALFQRRDPDGVTLWVPAPDPGVKALEPDESRRLLDAAVSSTPDLSWVGSR